MTEARQPSDLHAATYFAVSYSFWLSWASRPTWPANMGSSTGSIRKGALSRAHEILPGAFRFQVQFDPTQEAKDCQLAKWNGPIAPRVNHGISSAWEESSRRMPISSLPE